MTTSATPADHEVTGTNLHALRTGDYKPMPLSGVDNGDGTLTLNVTGTSGGGGGGGTSNTVAATNAGTTATQANPVQGVTGGVPVPVSGTFYQATQPVSIAASVPVTGAFYQATQPVSIASSVPVTGTFFPATQPVSLTVLPSLVASTAAIGQVGGKTTTVDVTPTITAAAYTAGYVVGGVLTFSNALLTAGTGMLQSIALKVKSTHSETFKLYVFKAAPTTSTFNDHAAPSITAADIPSLVGVYVLAGYDNGLGTHTIYVLDGIGKVLAPLSTTLYGVLTTTGAPTFASTSDMTVSLGILQD